MGKPTGFLEIPRRTSRARPVQERTRDWKEVYLLQPVEDVQRQGARCMDCGIPFCHQGCPLGNLIPEWNDLVYAGRWERAFQRLASTNNFPELTGRLCPAPCEGSCVLGIGDEPVAIKEVEVAIVERAFEEGWIAANPPAVRTGRRVAVVGSGPAGLAAADQLNRAGHHVTVFERADRIGGLLRYGIPEFKLEKRILDRRLALLAAEGIVFRPGVEIGRDVPVQEVRASCDALLLCGGAGVPRDLQVSGRTLDGVHFALDYLAGQNRRCEGDTDRGARVITAAGKRVVILGGGDTGADCLGTAHRQGARSVHQLELMERPPARRHAGNPWPEWPRVFRTSAAHQEGGERWFSVVTERFLSNGSGGVAGIGGRRLEENAAGADAPSAPFMLEADLVLLAMGFTGPERTPLLTDLDLRLTDRGTVWRDDDWMTSQPGVFTAGDMQRGQSLIVWAMADGRHAARAVDRWLMTQSDPRAAARLEV